MQPSRKTLAFVVASAVTRRHRSTLPHLSESEETIEELLRLERERVDLAAKMEVVQERQRLLALGLTPPKPRRSDDFWAVARSRLSWLTALLVCQSLSSVVLEAYTDTVTAHPTVVFFLTMLVGAGGNAGNQASVRVIRSLALGDSDLKLATELRMAIVLACGLSFVGFCRVLWDSGSTQDAVAITLSLFCIVFLSVVLGSLLPSLLDKIGAGPSNAATAIQVVMDILGVFLTCSICTLLLDS